MMRRLVGLTVLVGALSMAPSAEAAMILLIDNSGSTPPASDVSVTGVGGVASYSCFTSATCTAAGLSGWAVTVDTALSTPTLSSPAPHMHLNYVATSSAAGSLSLWLVEDNFSN